MTKKMLQVPKFYQKQVAGQQVSYAPVKAGANFTRADLLLLASERRQFTVAFTSFCPLHATNVHEASKCKPWQAKLAHQLEAKKSRGDAATSSQQAREDKAEAAFQSRQRERNL